MAGWVAVLVLLVTAVLAQYKTWDHKYERLGQWEAANPDSVTRLPATQTVLLVRLLLLVSAQMQSKAY